MRLLFVLSALLREDNATTFVSDKTSENQHLGRCRRLHEYYKHLKIIISSETF